MDPNEIDAIADRVVARLINAALILALFAAFGYAAISFIEHNPLWATALGLIAGLIAGVVYLCRAFGRLSLRARRTSLLVGIAAGIGLFGWSIYLHHINGTDTISGTVLLWTGLLTVVGCFYALRAAGCTCFAGTPIRRPGTGIRRRFV